MVEATKTPVVQATVTRRRWTRAEYEQMGEAGILDENDRVELVAGEIVTKVTQRSPHATAVGLGYEALRAVVGTGFHVRAQLPLALDPDSEPEPDLVVVAGSPRAYSDAHPTSALLVVEVSDTSLAFDRTWKMSIYARAGIPDYWIINLPDRLLEVYRDPGPDTAALVGYAYRQRLSFGPDDRVTLVAMPDATVAVRDLLP
jgi:Uma2 family endonuclease